MQFRTLMNSKILIRVLTIIIPIILIVALNIPVIKYAFSIIIISFIISYILTPAVNYLVKNNMNKKAATLFLLFAFLVIFSAIVSILIPSIIMETTGAQKEFDVINELLKNIENEISKFTKNEESVFIIQEIYTNVKSFVSASLAALINSIMSFGKNIVGLTVVPVITYYIIVDGEDLIAIVLKFFPVTLRNSIRLFWKDIDKILRRYIYAQFLLSVFVFIFTFIALYMLNIKYALLLSILNGVFNIIPIFGPIIGTVPAILIAFLMSPYKALYVFIAYLIIQQIEANIIAPKITGETINIHPVVIILLILIGQKIGGVFGMIVCIPIAAMIKIIYEDINYYFF
ncbi:MAG: AI-2E family transporter [Oscillospiraceae bacterium]|nr:AI-2E family transporter [Oscillospiraceae bacterium]